MYSPSRLASDTIKVCEELDYEQVSADTSWQDWRLEEEDGRVKTVGIDLANNEVMLDVEDGGERVMYREYSAYEEHAAVDVKRDMCR
ncbi:MAG: hypothetical protein H9W81_13810 [Enterococcus sp.]|nr:hypothetical protein [Enterococcus sp.]